MEGLQEGLRQECREKESREKKKAKKKEGWVKARTVDEEIR